MPPISPWPKFVIVLSYTCFAPEIESIEKEGDF